MKAAVIAVAASGYVQSWHHENCRFSAGAVYNRTCRLSGSNYFDVLMQERRNSIASAMELRLSCINTWACTNILVPHHVIQITAIHPLALNRQTSCGDLQNIVESSNKLLGPLLLIWFNLNPSMDNWLYPSQSVVQNYLSIPKRQWCNR